MNIFKKFKYILGSGSPRRSQLLSEAGFEFDIRVSDVDESFPDDLATEKVAEYLANIKAAALSQDLNDGELLITADSVVIYNNEILGKPVDSDDAYRMIAKLSGNKHEVITGVCLSTNKKSVSFSVGTKVSFDELTEEEIKYYINTCKPYDKAGAYGVQEWIGHCKVSSMEGTHTNVMGLPVRELYKHLIDF